MEVCRNENDPAEPDESGLRSKRGGVRQACRLRVRLREGLEWVLRTYTLSPHLVSAPCLHALSATLRLHTLSLRFVSAPCLHALSATLRLHTLSLRFVERMGDWRVSRTRLMQNHRGMGVPPMAGSRADCIRHPFDNTARIRLTMRQVAVSVRHASDVRARSHN